MAEGPVLADGFVHCAGILLLGAFRVSQPDQEAALFAVNVFSAIEIVRFLIRKVPNRASLNHIVFVSSAASLFGVRGNVLYTASKGALDAFMKSAAIELAPRCRVNSVLPGLVQGGMSDLTRDLAGFEDSVRTNYPLGLGTPEQVAGIVEMLFSDRASWITGQQILVDGGFSAHCNRTV
jgi:NAD(P)-dependent dehydrogenase (short-subunit alcohol dehydrogenase family)